MNQKLWLESIQLEYGADVAATCRGILYETDRKKEAAKREAEMERMVREILPAVGRSVYDGDIRMFCAAALEAGYRKFEIVEDDV